MALDGKFGIVLDQRSKLGVSEPVFVIRGNDLLAEKAIYEYAELAKVAGLPDNFVDAVKDAAATISAYQAAHPHNAKLPD